MRLFVGGQYDGKLIDVPDGMPVYLAAEPVDLDASWIGPGDEIPTMPIATYRAERVVFLRSHSDWMPKWRREVLTSLDERVFYHESLYDDRGQLCA